MTGEEPRPRANGRHGRRFEVAAVAIRLFSERGLDSTTAEDIAREAGVSPRTFFRYFPTKEAAAFPDHEERVAELTALLADGSRDLDPIALAVETSRTMMAEYFFEHPEVYRPRYRLVRDIPALREHERISDLDYERALSSFFVSKYPEDPQIGLKAQLAGAALVTVFNHVLDAWAGDEVGDPGPLLNRETTTTETWIRTLLEPAPATSEPPLVVVVSGPSALQRRVKKALSEVGVSIDAETQAPAPAQTTPSR